MELFEAVVAETDYEFGGWKEFEFDALIPALDDEQIDFSDPYYSADQSIVVREGGDFSPEALSDLSGHPVGAQKGTTGEGIVKDELVAGGVIKESNYKAYDNYTLAVQDLVNGNIDAIVLDRPVAETFADQRAVVVAFTYETGERYGFGIREGDSARAEAINEGLSTVQDDGTYTELRNKWFGASE